MTRLLQPSMEEPGAWYEFPAALKTQDQVIGWVAEEDQARCMADVYELRGNPMWRTARLLKRVRAQGGRYEGAERFSDVEVEVAGSLLLPGFPVALKWNGQVVAWVRNEPFARLLASMLNVFIRVWRQRLDTGDPAVDERRATRLLAG